MHSPRKCSGPEALHCVQTYVGEKRDKALGADVGAGPGAGTQPPGHEFNGTVLVRENRSSDSKKNVNQKKTVFCGVLTFLISPARVLLPNPGTVEGDG